MRPFQGGPDALSDQDRRSDFQDVKPDKGKDGRLKRIRKGKMRLIHQPDGTECIQHRKRKQTSCRLRGQIIAEMVESPSRGQRRQDITGQETACRAKQLLRTPRKTGKHRQAHKPKQQIY